jgi:hypothetical protein
MNNYIIGLSILTLISIIVILLRLKRKYSFYKKPPLTYQDENFIDENIEKETDSRTSEEKSFMQEYINEMSKNY